jgi:hypothetical protein
VEVVVRGPIVVVAVGLASVLVVERSRSSLEETREEEEGEGRGRGARDGWWRRRRMTREGSDRAVYYEGDACFGRFFFAASCSARVKGSEIFFFSFQGRMSAAAAATWMVRATRREGQSSPVMARVH